MSLRLQGTKDAILLQGKGTQFVKGAATESAETKGITNPLEAGVAAGCDCLHAVEEGAMDRKRARKVRSRLVCWKVP